MLRAILIVITGGIVASIHAVWVKHVLTRESRRKLPANIMTERYRTSSGTAGVCIASLKDLLTSEAILQATQARYLSDFILPGGEVQEAQRADHRREGVRVSGISTDAGADRVRADTRSQSGDRFSHVLVLGVMASRCPPALQTIQGNQAGYPGTADDAVDEGLVDPLSPRELEVLDLIVGGFTNREIAAQLHISINTVKKHVNHIFSKLDVDNRVHAMARSQQLGILSSSSPDYT